MPSFDNIGVFLIVLCTNSNKNRAKCLDIGQKTLLGGLQPQKNSMMSEITLTFMAYRYQNGRFYRENGLNAFIFLIFLSF